MGSHVALDLPHGRGNPRNSEGAFVTLADGRILFAFSRYYGRSWADGATASIAAVYSRDSGRTWSRTPRLLIRNEGRCNVMSVSLLRLRDGRIALFYLVKNDSTDCRLHLRTSTDEGETWSRRTLCVPPPGYFVTNNDRVVQLRSGRLVAPASYHRALGGGTGRARRQERIDSRGTCCFFLSDDAGRTWREAKTWWALPVDCNSGLQEPGVVELTAGRLYAFCRTGTGRHYQLLSRDGGETWSAPGPSPFRAPCSPLSIKRIPSTGHLLAVWNDHHPRWHLPSPTPTSWGRTPLTLALSPDEGASWRRHHCLETNRSHGYCYTAIHFTDDAVLLAYCCGGGRSSGVLQDLRIRRVTLDWVYGGKAPSCRRA